MKMVLVTGGARSGKSRFAEARLAELAAATGQAPPWTYLATAEALDDEMAERIAHHRERRGAGWRTVEAPRDPAEAIARAPGALLLDCVTLWLSNLLMAERSDEDVLRAVDALAEAARRAHGPVVLVTNEVGAGIVPDSPLGRRFRDLAGFANQRLAAAADAVYVLIAGQPLRLK